MSALLRVIIVQILLAAVVHAPGPRLDLRQRRWKSATLYLFSLLYSVLTYLALFRLSALWILPTAFALGVLSLGLLGGTRRAPRVLTLSAILLTPPGVFAATLDPGDFAGVLVGLRSAADSPDVLLVVLGYGLIIWPAGELIGRLTRPLRTQLDPELAEGLSRAGLWIGRLERILAYSLVLLGQEAAIAFLVTAKSVFRFGEIKDSGNRKETEYILIGTLLSFSVAMGVGYAVRLLTA